MIGRKIAVGRPEDDTQFKKLAAEREQLHEKRESLSQEWARLRARNDDLGGRMAVTNPSNPVWTELKEESRKTVARLNEIEAERQTLKAQLRELADRIPRERSRAAGEIGRQVAPAFNKAAREYMLARLERLGPEIAAAAEVRRLVAEAEARRVGRYGWASIFGPAQDEREHAQLREDVRSALAAGALKSADIPTELRELWRL